MKKSELREMVLEQLSPIVETMLETLFEKFKNRLTNFSLINCHEK